MCSERCAGWVFFSLMILFIVYDKYVPGWANRRVDSDAQSIAEAVGRGGPNRISGELFLPMPFHMEALHAVKIVGNIAYETFLFAYFVES